MSEVQIGQLLAKAGLFFLGCYGFSKLFKKKKNKEIEEEVNENGESK